MADSWATDIVKAMQDQAEQAVTRSSSQGADVMFATVISTKPLKLTVNDLEIKKQVYVNPAILLESEQPENIPALFAGGLAILAQCPEIAPGPVELYDFLCKYHEAAVIRTGDTVAVMKVNAGFYVLEKVVQAV